MNTKSTSLLFLFIALTTYCVAQTSSLRGIVEVPVQFGIGYEGSLNKRFSVAISAGILTSPNSTIIIDVLKDLGTDPDITLMIQDAFKLGFVGKLGVNYNFKRSYVGAFGEIFALQAGNVPTATFESFFNTSLSTYPIKRGSSASQKDLHMTSAIYQGGILYGHRFPFKNKRFEIDAEFAFSANITSKTTVTSNGRDLSSINPTVNSTLASYYSEYAFVPSLAVIFVYKLKAH